MFSTETEWVEGPVEGWSVPARFGAGVGVDGKGGAGSSTAWHFTEELAPLQKEKPWRV